MSRVVPLLNVPCAVNCSVSPAATDGFPGDTWMETRYGNIVSLHPVIAPTIASTEINRSLFKEHLAFFGKYRCRNSNNPAVSFLAIPARGYSLECGLGLRQSYPTDLSCLSHCISKHKATNGEHQATATAQSSVG